MGKNKEDLKRDLANQRQRFSIRKLSIGAASVLLGTALFFVNGGYKSKQILLTLGLMLSKSRLPKMMTALLKMIKQMRLRLLMM